MVTPKRTPPIPPVPFGRVLRQTDHGHDVQAVTRSLARAGFGHLAEAGQILTPEWVKFLRRFQAASGLQADGVYGPVTHGKLRRYFDRYSFLLYTGHQPFPPPAALLLPAAFPPTHPTAGLAGFPAIDVMAPAGTTVGAPDDGKIYKLSGKDPRLGGTPGLAYGWSLYLESRIARYYVTHLGTRIVKLGERVESGQEIGTVCDARVAHMSTSLSHVHLGRQSKV